MQTVTPLGLDRAKELAPAMFATGPAPTIKSPKYQFTPTLEVVDHMSDLGFQLTSAKQSKTKDDWQRNWGIHICRFQNPDLYIKNSEGGIEARPEIVMINSHNGLRPVQFELGLFRLVCENGLVIKAQDFGGFRERHTKYTFAQLKEMLDQKVEAMRPVVQKISSWASRLMTDKERYAFAVEALALRLSGDRQPENYEVLEVLQPKRKADEGKTLWHTYNTLQENLIKGGFQMGERTARAITNPIQDLKVNQDLWQLAEVYAG